MCGIAGIIHRNRTGRIGNEMTKMLQAMRHRGPDSTGFALYGEPSAGILAMRFKVAEKEDLASGFQIRDQIVQRRAEVDERIASLGGEVLASEQPTEYAFLYRVRYEGDLRRFADFIEDAEGVEILSIGSALELVKDLGDANEVSEQYGMGSFMGTHAIGHVRMATESDVDIRSAHPYWAYPFGDISVVHNGQLTNYWSMRRDLERRGHRFVSDCDSELIAVYIADSLDRSISLDQAMVKSVRELDGVFTYLVATTDSLGMAKDTMAAKPMVLYEGEEETLLASEEVAIRTVLPQEIETVDPYAGEVRVWQN